MLLLKSESRSGRDVKVKIPEDVRLDVPDEKLEEYLLSESHPSGS